MPLKLKNILNNNSKNIVLNESLVSDIIALIFGKKMNDVVKQVSSDPELKKGMKKIMDDIEEFKKSLKNDQNKINTFLKK